MSRSFRGRPDPQDNPEQGRDAQPRGAAPQGRGNLRPNLRPGQQADSLPAQQDRSSNPSSDADYDEADQSGEQTNLDQGKRLVAGLIDVVTGYILNLAVNCIPFVNMFLHDQIVMVSFLIVKDFLFHGRGIGKNLMGLQVIDIRTGAACSLMQSVKRNIVLFGPYLALYTVNQVIKFIPDENIKSIVQNVIVGAGTIYFLIAIPYEIYRVYTRADGRRWGDELAGTATVPGDMDFSNPMSK